MDREKLIYKAIWLAWITIGYNIVEGLVSIYFGIKGDSIALFGFGADSFIETISATGILFMLFRLQRSEAEKQTAIEKNALYITGSCFYLLAGFLTFESLRSIISGDAPENTLPGIIITLLSIGFMYAIIKLKTNIGKGLNSKAIIADANCGKVCLYMSFVVLASSAIYVLFHITWIDALGAAGLVYFSVREGNEAFEKAKGKDTCGCDHCH